MIGYSVMLAVALGICIQANVCAQEAQADKIRVLSSDQFFKDSTEINKIRKKNLLSVKSLNEFLKDKHPLVIDVRSSHAYKRKHIKGAVNLCMADITPQSLKKIIDGNDRVIVLYCDSALELMPTRMIALSTQAYPLIYMHGYKNLYEVQSLWLMDKSHDRASLKAYLEIPFEGDDRVIEDDRKVVQAALSKP